METLIINKRHEMPKHKRLLWDVFTVVLWGGWIYLWKPVIVVFYKIIMLDAPIKELSDVIYEEVNAIPFEHAIIMLTLTPIILFILSRLNRHGAPTEHRVLEASEYAEYYNLDTLIVDQAKQSQYVTVYHDDHGQIINLVTQIDR